MLAVAVTPALATQEEPKVDECGESFEYTKSNDFSDNRVSIDFINTASPGFPDSVAVNAQVANGYTLTKVELNVNNDNQGGFVDHTASFPGTFNPNPGETIEVAKVTVEKTCTEVCDDPEATNYEEPKEGSTVANRELCVYPEPTPEPTPEPETPKTVSEPTQLPETGGGLEWLLFGLGTSGIGTGLKFLLRRG